MITAQLHDNKIVIQDVENITLAGRKGAIVKVLGCGLCGSDIVKFKQKLVKDGTVLGHEVVGEIVEINSIADFKIGDVIVSSHHIPCGKCIYCKSGHVSMCRHFKQTNIFPGGFSEYVYLSEEHLMNVAYKKPENLTEIEASFYEPLACCVRAVRNANLSEDDNVLVIGLGSIGLLMSQAIKEFTPNVLGSDLLDDRINFAKSLGINACKNLDETYCPDVVFLTAGADKTVDLAIKKVRDGGKIIVFASTPNSAPFPNNEIYYRELTVMGSYSPDLQDLAHSLELLKSKKVKTDNISTVYSIRDLAQAIDDTLCSKIKKAYIKM